MPAPRRRAWLLAAAAAATLLAGGCRRAPEAVPTPVATAAAAPPATAAAPTATASPDPVEPFPGQRDVRVDDLMAAIVAELEAIAAGPAVRRDYEAFLATNGLADDAALYADYLRIRVAFEATRAGGWWGLRWQITDREPQSDAVWTQWRTLSLTDDDPLPATSAIAECDELSALFAVVAHGLGLSRRSEAGLFWPTANHTVAVWTIDRTGAKPVRVVVPTSQVFLAPSESLGTRQFDAWSQPAIYDYRRIDAAGDSTIPAPLARRFVLAVRTHGLQAQGVSQSLRNLRELRQAGG